MPTAGGAPARADRTSMPAYAFATVRAPRATTTSTWWMPWRARWSSPASISFSVPGQRRSPSAFAGRRQPRSSGRTMKGRIGRGPFQGERYGSGRPRTRAARWWRPCGGRPPIGLDHLKFRNSKCLESGDGFPLARECRRFSETRCFYAGGHSRESMSSRKRGEGTRFGQRIPKLENHASCHDMDAVIAFPRAAPRIEDPPRRDPGRS